MNGRRGSRGRGGNGRAPARGEIVWPLGKPATRIMAISIPENSSAQAVDSYVVLEDMTTIMTSRLAYNGGDTWREIGR